MQRRPGAEADRQKAENTDVARITIRHGELVIEVERVERIWALRCQLEIPLDHVVGAVADRSPLRDRPRSVEGVGPERRVLDAVTFVHAGDRVAWGVRDPAGAIVITLDDERYPRLVVEVEDPTEAVARINTAVATRGRP